MVLIFFFSYFGELSPSSRIKTHTHKDTPLFTESIITRAVRETQQHGKFFLFQQGGHLAGPGTHGPTATSH